MYISRQETSIIYLDLRQEPLTLYVCIECPKIKEHKQYWMCVYVRRF